MNRRLFLRISLGLVGALVFHPKVLFQKPGKQLFLLRKKIAITETYIKTMKSLVKINKADYPEWVKNILMRQMLLMGIGRIHRIRSTMYLEYLNDLRGGGSKSLRITGR